MANKRETSIEISKYEFKKIGCHLLDTISNFIDSIEQKRVTTGESPKQLQQILGTSSIPENGSSAEEIVLMKQYAQVRVFTQRHSFHLCAIRTFVLAGNPLSL